MGASPPDPHRGFAPGPHRATSVPRAPRFAPPRKDFLATPLILALDRFKDSILNAVFSDYLLCF